MHNIIIFLLFVSFATTSCKPKSDEQNQASENISQGPATGFYLSSDSGERTREITNIISGELDEFSDPSQKELMKKVFFQSKVPIKNSKIKNIAVIGAGPAGLMQALLAFEQGYNVHIIEKRLNFERDHIFQIDENDFDKNIRKYLSPKSFEKLTELGVLQSYSIEGSIPERRIVTIATRDLENILYGVVKNQEKLSSRKIQITKGAELNPDRIDAKRGELVAEIVEKVDGQELRTPHTVKADAVIVATGAGGGSKPYLEKFDLERIDDFNSKQIRPIGVLVEIKYPAGKVSPEFLDRLNIELARRFPVDNTLNFLRLDGQGKLQINVQITGEQYDRWFGSVLNSNGTLDWSQYKIIGDQTKNFFKDEVLYNVGDDSPGLKWLRDQSINTWVADQPISRVDRPAVLVDGKIPLAFVGDAQGNNWFLNGDGNPREHQMASIVLDEFGKGGDLDSVIERIETRSLAFIDSKNLEIMDSKVLGKVFGDSGLPNNVLPFDPRRKPDVPNLKAKPVVKPKVPITDVPKVRVKL
ncbi:MAG: NAD(P)/FAD-dependent oxidoreductase [Saprospiraceae bacterium]